MVPNLGVMKPRGVEGGTRWAISLLRSSKIVLLQELYYRALRWQSGSFWDYPCYGHGIRWFPWQLLITLIWCSLTFYVNLIHSFFSFSFRALENDEDIVDSDFSIDEDDEVVSDHEADKEFKRKRTVGTKAYKEPVKPKEKDKAVAKKPKVLKKKAAKPSTSNDTELGKYFVIWKHQDTFFLYKNTNQFTCYCPCLLVVAAVILLIFYGYLGT